MTLTFWAGCVCLFFFIWRTIYESKDKFAIGWLFACIWLTVGLLNQLRDVEQEAKEQHLQEEILRLEQNEEALLKMIEYLTEEQNKQVSKKRLI